MGIRLALMLATALIAFSVAAQDYDILLRGGTVIDGTGAPRVEADVGIFEGRIAFIGSGGDAEAKEVIDVTGLVVTPGFVDVHNHTETAIAQPDQRLNEGFVRQGVTTIVGGADGSLEPRQMRRLIDAYAKNGAGTNVMLQVGHNGARRRVMGRDQQRPPTQDELAQMQALVKEGMEFGAVGLSSGLMYEPGMFSDTAEVIALAQVVKPYNGIYDSHTRDPVHRCLYSETECAEIGEAAGIPSKLAHLKGVGLQNEGVISEVIAMVEDHRKRGHVVVSDQYPYDGAATSSLRDIVIVPKDQVSGLDLNAALADPQLRARIKETSENGIDGGFAWLKATGYKAMRITNYAARPELEGRYLSDLAVEWEIDPFDTVATLLMEEEGTIYITLGAIKEPDVQILMTQPWNMIASDGEYSDSKRANAGGHPRSTGTFPRVLGHYVREVKLLSLEEAVRKMTSLPADTVGLPERGRLAVGLIADIAVFDPDTIADTSTWLEPSNMAVGVVHVFVGGIPVLKNGVLTGNAPGGYIHSTGTRLTLD